jgi:hypothetical protein
LKYDSARESGRIVEPLTPYVLFLYRCPFSATVYTQVLLSEDAQAFDGSPVNSFVSRSITEGGGSFTESKNSVELQKTQWNSVSPQQREATE